MLFTRMEPLRFRPRWLARGREHGRRRHATTPRSAIRSAASLFAVYEPVVPLGAPPSRASRSCSRVALVASTVPVYLRLGSEFMPPLERGRVPLHADGAAGHVGHGGAAHPPDPGPDPADVPGGRARLRQGRARRLADRPGAVLDGRDDGHAEARGGVAADRALVLRLAGARCAGSSRGSRPSASRSRSCRARWTPSCASPASRTSGRCRSRTGSTCSRPASGRRSASRSSAPTSTTSSASASSSRACCATFRARATSSPSAPPAATTSTSTSSARSSPATGSPSTDAQAIVTSAIGGENVTTTIEGRERYPVNVRYARDFRDDSRASSACSSRRRPARRSRWRSSPTCVGSKGRR